MMNKNTKKLKAHMRLAGLKPSNIYLNDDHEYFSPTPVERIESLQHTKYSPDDWGFLVLKTGSGSSLHAYVELRGTRIVFQTNFNFDVVLFDFELLIMEG